MSILKWFHKLLGRETESHEPTNEQIIEATEILDAAPVPESQRMVAPVEAEPSIGPIEDDGFITIYPPVHSGIDRASEEPVAGPVPASDPVVEPVGEGSSEGAGPGPLGREGLPEGVRRKSECEADGIGETTGQRYGFHRVVRSLRRTNYRSEQRTHNRD